VGTEIPTPAEITVLTYNIWIKEDKRKERIEQFVTLIEKHKVDIVATQETTPYAHSLISAHPYIQEHFYLSLLSGQQSMYKVAFLSKFPFSALTLLDVPFKNAPRKTVVAEFNFDCNPLCMVTVHLESDADEADIRASQLEYVVEHLEKKGTKSAIILGDFNFHYPIEEEFFARSGFNDVWCQCHEAKEGGTYGNMRLDRVCSKSSGWKCHAIEVTPAGKPPAISDHQGIISKFSPSENKIQKG